MNVAKFAFDAWLIISKQRVVAPMSQTLRPPTDIMNLGGADWQRIGRELVPEIQTIG